MPVTKKSPATRLTALAKKTGFPKRLFVVIAEDYTDDDFSCAVTKGALRNIADDGEKVAVCSLK